MKKIYSLEEGHGFLTFLKLNMLIVSILIFNFWCLRLRISVQDFYVIGILLRKIVIQDSYWFLCHYRLFSDEDNSTQQAYW